MLTTGGASLGLEKRRRAEFVQVIVCRRIEVSLPEWFCPWAASPQSNVFRNRTMSVFLPGAPSMGCWGRFIRSLHFVCFLSCVSSHRGLGDPSSVAGTGELPPPMLRVSLETCSPLGSVCGGWQPPPRGAPAPGRGHREALSFVPSAPWSRPIEVF